jgi:hypothetical protein
MPAHVYRFQEHWTIPGFPPREVYEVVADGRLLTHWWKGVYLAAEPLDGAGGGDAAPGVGSRVRVKARGALPYALYFVLETTDLDPGRLVEVRTRGDFEGVWRAAFAPASGGTRVDIEWTVTVQKPLVRLLSPLLRPLFAWNHRWTTPRGEAGLRAYLGARRAGRRVEPWARR